MNNNSNQDPARLILLSNSFPYGNWEPYLETEVAYYDSFDEIHILALQIRKEHRSRLRRLPSEKFHIFPVDYAPKSVYLLNSVRALFDKNLYKEMGKLMRQHRLNPSTLVKLFVYLSRAHYEARHIKKYLRESGLMKNPGKGVLYVYRFEYQPYLALLLQKYLPGYKIVARAHGYDLYEGVNSAKYIPLREYLLERLEKVVLISEAGLQYLAEQFPTYREKMQVSKLGTADCGINQTALEHPLQLVSCSTVNPIKRLHLIARALAKVRVEVIWTHYGDGVSMDELKDEISKLPQNVRVNLRGMVPNRQVLDDYAKEPYHLFLNVSASEGIPVSIMEAMSFGIPCIATDVGGNGEVVTDGFSGRLMPAEFEPEELARRIEDFAAMSAEEYRVFRENARKDWYTKHCAENNYPGFVSQLRSLVED